ncbi:MAG: hypothetical protein Q9181_002625 [Wetmoreana brouardii]
MARNLLQLPHEVLHGILVNVAPGDLAALRCCHMLDDFIENDGLLCKEIYTRHFLFEIGGIVDCVQDLIKSASVTRLSLNVSFLDRLLKAQKNIEILCNSSLFKWASATSQPSNSPSSHRSSCVHSRSRSNSGRSVGNTLLREHSGAASLDHVFVGYGQDDSNVVPAQRTNSPINAETSVVARKFRRLSAKLHCLYGVPVQHLPRSSAASHHHDLRASKGIQMHPFARSRVYDLRQHTENTFWGPFTNDGSQSVDWEKVEALMIILSHNIRAFADKYSILHSVFVPSWDEPFVGVTPYSLKLVPQEPEIERPPRLPLSLQDPYNVTGVWMRVVCFLDYRELFTFNFSEDQPLPGQPRQPIEIEEAIRFMMIKLEVSKIEQPAKGDGQGLPVVHFKGTSTSALPPVDPNANSKIRGMVRLTPENEVRWTTFSVFHGEERWRSEGIQVGGVQAARGIIGYWFDKDFDEYGPAGPTAFWKVSDDLHWDIMQSI